MTNNFAIGTQIVYFCTRWFQYIIYIGICNFFFNKFYLFHSFWSAVHLRCIVLKIIVTIRGDTVEMYFETLGKWTIIIKKYIAIDDLTLSVASARNNGRKPSIPSYYLV